MEATASKCPKCGANLSWSESAGPYCTSCGYKAPVKQPPIISARGARSQIEQPGDSDLDIYSGLAKPTRFGAGGEAPHFFNWGALFLPFVWSLGNRLWLWTGVMGGMWLVSVILYVAFMISAIRPTMSGANPMSSPMFALSLIITMYGILVFVVNLGISIYLGLDGNRLAWNARGFTSAKAFRDEQRVWAIVGLVVVGLMFLLFIINVVMGIVFFSQILGSFPGVPK
jgi:DNA-directed RNA polymerase subunit RPC12/RpoP